MLKTILQMPLRARLKQAQLPSLLRFHSTSSDSVSDEIYFKNYGTVREIALNRPEKLNVLNQNMCDIIVPRLQEYMKSKTAGIILLKGAGNKAFCAGGDVVALASQLRANKEQGISAAIKYFLSEFSLDHFIATYPKPVVAFMDGITMGGGFGLAGHAPFRIATEKTVFAMPETVIGYTPDVGGMFHLSRLDGELGLYLALTAGRLNGYEVYQNRIASHYVVSERLPELEQRLAEIAPIDGDATSSEYFDIVNRLIEDFSSEAPLSYQPSLSKDDRITIDECFKFNSVEDIIAALNKTNTPFAKNTVQKLLELCPTSLKVTLALYRSHKKSDIKCAFETEARVAENMCHRADFVEGVTALLVEKRKPLWSPTQLNEVSIATVSSILTDSPSGAKPEFYTDRTFSSYPHNYNLPSEDAIMQFVIGETNPSETKASREDVLRHFSSLAFKIGLEKRIDEVLSRKTKPDSSNDRLLDWLY